jgi:DNA-directed RNA polymerase specialized sigma24 family protein
LQSNFVAGDEFESYTFATIRSKSIDAIRVPQKIADIVVADH